MNQQSAVQFETRTRVHVALPVRDVDRSTEFYATLFGQRPTKTRPGYAKFEVAEPPVNLTLNQTDGATAPVNPVSHFGIQVKDTDAVAATSARLKAAGLETRDEENVTCCYAVQDKVWVADPDGNPWEVFVVLDNAPAQESQSGACCTPSQSGACCTPLAAGPQSVPGPCCATAG